jgi:hypothetical protein
MLDSPGGTGYYEIRFPVHGCLGSRNVHVFDCVVKESMRFVMYLIIYYVGWGLFIVFVYRILWCLVWGLLVVYVKFLGLIQYWYKYDDC